MRDLFIDIIMKIYYNVSKVTCVCDVNVNGIYMFN